MAVKKLKPDNPSQRYRSVSTFDELTTNKPYRKLSVPIKKTGGRNNQGRITSRRRGGGHRRRYRIIDFKWNKFDKREGNHVYERIYAHWRTRRNMEYYKKK